MIPGFEGAGYQRQRPRQRQRQYQLSLLSPLSCLGSHPFLDILIHDGPRDRLFFDVSELTTRFMTRPDSNLKALRVRQTLYDE